MRKSIYITLSEKKGENPKVFAVDNRVGGDDYIFWIKEFEKLDYDVNLVNWDDYKDKSFSRVYHHNSSSFVEPKVLCSNDAIMLYKQEGFFHPENWDRFHRMLNGLEKSGAFVINDPKTIRWNISKEHLYYLMEKGATVCKVHEVKDALERMETGEKFVVKPKIAARGIGMVLVKDRKDIEKINSLEDKTNYIAQEFCDGIRDGERSLFYVGHDYSHAVLKIPNPENPTEIRCNKSVGGSVSQYDPTDEEIDYTNNIIDLISEEYPVIFSRIDFAYHNGKPHLIEAELLNPSAFATFAGVGKDFGERLVGHLNKLIEEHLDENNIYD
jgi:glutathione synthase/RimK-type ligase-like ATP-grasp enzyme